MLGPLEFFEKFSDAVKLQAWRHPETERLDFKVPVLRHSRLPKAEPQEMIHGGFEWNAPLLHLLTKKLTHILIESQCCPHIMMIALEAS